MNRINPALFAAAFTDWVRQSWPEKAELVAIDGKSSRRSHDHKAGAAPLHLVFRLRHHPPAGAGAAGGARQGERTRRNSAATTAAWRRRRAEGALVSIDAIATNATIAAAITAEGADYLLAVKANQPTLRTGVEAALTATAAAAPDGALETCVSLDKGHGRIEERRMAVLREVDRMRGERRFPGELRLPGIACLLRAETRVETNGRHRCETRYFVSFRPLAATKAAEAVRQHWAIENRLHLRARRHLRR